MVFTVDREEFYVSRHLKDNLLPVNHWFESQKLSSMVVK